MNTTTTNTTTTNTIKNSMDAVRSQYIKRIEKAVENNGKNPTVDSNGRSHAPFDGYMWIDGNTYLAGQYLPESEEYAGTSYQVKMKIAESVYPILQEIMACSKGKSWVENGITVCYCYANVSRAEKSALEAILPPAEKRIVLADDACTSKKWIFNTKKVVKSYVYRYGASWVEMFRDFAEHENPGVTFNAVFKKDGKVTFNSDFDGKEVCYAYPSYISE